MQRDVIIIGGGIIGFSTAYHLKLQNPDLDVLLLEKENNLAEHQTGHNSGVIHSGIYYKPGSHKAEFSKKGSQSMIHFCREYNIPYNQCGKVIVATDENELDRLRALYERGLQNGLQVTLLNAEEVNQIEPYVQTVGGIKVQETAIVNYKKVTEQFKLLFEELGGEINFNTPVTSIKTSEDKIVLNSYEQQFKSKSIINCAGLYSDKIARMSGVNTDIQIIPFRGEYYQLNESKEKYVQTLIYPVPNPELPFLGVHFTNMIDGGVDVGPNAVLGLRKEAYKKIGLDKSETLEILKFPGLYKMGIKNIKEALGEYYRSFNKRAFVNNAQKLIPSLRKEDIEPIEAGVRAQAMLSDGTLLDDFVFEKGKHSLHVLNAPSPAATCSIEIGKAISKEFEQLSILK
ncbi:hydroxyglutarate oxidase [Mammaliicoccus lentus]|uniref:L-2-hydroxyglutarate oxidase n=2 Tax=Bacillales TaxID=1385 RepID=A0AAX3W4I3_MAMLE|nr:MULTISPECIES: L-2-hydroxyglutarate oxidase [Mammaliicoccus]HBV03002.1 L-2-hydroxyglutarate oxidase [Staphylococcus sp.]MBF0794948.1 L-2-hydroxyglutarate oxidase [Mammaliicoccus lentus]MBW0767357.1 L-2-hydroxyglutarate oxidase [Mammaliicoccus lentus]MCD2477593.1 L-2-hydroxyglutarate oxidase [Mammaliicoccus lentus]MCD2521060.1 L-2-hydroxyglutarate oxidase [Mammaliicoccus lentus]